MATVKMLSTISTNNFFSNPAQGLQTKIS